MRDILELTIDEEMLARFMWADGDYQLIDIVNLPGTDDEWIVPARSLNPETIKTCFRTLIQFQYLMAQP